MARYYYEVYYEDIEKFIETINAPKQWVKKCKNCSKPGKNHLYFYSLADGVAYNFGQDLSRNSHLYKQTNGYRYLGIFAKSPIVSDILSVI